VSWFFVAKEYVRSGGVWLLRLGHKGNCQVTMFSFESFILGKASWHVMKTIKKPHEEAHMARILKLLPKVSIHSPTMCVAILEMDPLIFVKPSALANTLTRQPHER
jgi:hypothetical protein